MSKKEYIKKLKEQFLINPCKKVILTGDIIYINTYTYSYMSPKSIKIDMKYKRIEFHSEKSHSVQDLKVLALVDEVEL